MSISCDCGNELCPDIWYHNGYCLKPRKREEAMRKAAKPTKRAAPEPTVDPEEAIELFMEYAAAENTGVVSTDWGVLYSAVIKALNRRLDDCIKLVGVRGDFVKKLETLRIEE